MTDKALRYDTEKPKLHHVHPFVWENWLTRNLKSRVFDLVEISFQVDSFFYHHENITESLDKAWQCVSPEDMKEMVKVLEFGAKKYEEWNWMKGMKWSRVLNSFRRHLFAMASGEEIDPESGIFHMGHVCCNLMFLTVYAVNNIGVDDRPNFNKTLSDECVNWAVKYLPDNSVSMDSLIDIIEKLAGKVKEPKYLVMDDETATRFYNYFVPFDLHYTKHGHLITKSKDKGKGVYFIEVQNDVSYNRSF